MHGRLQNTCAHFPLLAHCIDTRPQRGVLRDGPEADVNAYLREISKGPFKITVPNVRLAWVWGGGGEGGGLEIEILMGH